MDNKERVRVLVLKVKAFSVSFLLLSFPFHFLSFSHLAVSSQKHLLPAVLRLPLVLLAVRVTGRLVCAPFWATSLVFSPPIRRGICLNHFRCLLDADERRKKTLEIVSKTDTHCSKRKRFER